MKKLRTYKAKFKKDDELHEIEISGASKKDVKDSINSKFRNPDIIKIRRKYIININ